MTRRIAANPIPWWSQAGKTREVFEDAFTALRDIGFTAVKADVPEGMSAAEYLRWLGDFGLDPSTGLFSSPLDASVDVPQLLDAARRFGAEQAALGLDRTMLSSMSVPERMARPAVGAGFDQDRYDRAVDLAGRVCEVLLSEGVRPLHHSHVGGVFETEAEVTGLLDTLGPDLLGFGPDTGHLAWAGADPVALVRRYADRTGAIHLKDVHSDHLPTPDGAAAAAGDYRTLSRSGRVWAEPGRGVLDLRVVLAALPEDYDGDWMIEVDHPSVGDVVESHRISFAWAQEVLGPVAA